MASRDNKRQILKGIYEENLWVTGKGSQPIGKKLARKISRSSNAIPLVIVFITVIAISAGLIFWKYPVDGDSDKLSKVAANNTKDISLNAATSESEVAKNGTIGIKKDPQSTRNEAIMIAEALQRQLGDTGEASAVPVDKKAINPDRYQALTNTNIPLSKLFGLRVKTIIIDPGHGGKDPGAIGKLGAYEKDVALEIGKNLRDRLKKHGHYDVLMTRETDETMSLSERVEFANVNNADLFISIHVNTFPSNKQSFVETYYFGATDDSEVAELAARENAESHFQYAEFKEMIRKIGDTLKFQESRQLAQAVQTNLYQHVREINKQTRNHGIKSAPFVVLLGLDAPSILTEVSCFCNADEEKRLKSSKYREKIAAFLEQGIVKYLNRSTNVGGKRNGEKEELAEAQ